MINEVRDIKFFFDAGKQIERLRDDFSISRGSKDKLKDVSEEFEAIFVNLMLKEMRKSINETGFLKGYREDIFRDLLYWEYSKLIAVNTPLGIAEKIYELIQHSKT
ncbi:MAG: rod-binding protein [Brevinematia bacterium]